MASTSTRPEKRPRTESSDNSLNTSDTGITRSEPWFFDGTIVLEAERTQFRVHKGVLAAASPVFKDMLEVCQSGSVVDMSSDREGQGLVDGCHVVHMSDAWRELQHLLKAIYERDYHAAPTQPMPFDVAAAFLRLGKKYEIGYIHSQALLRFTTEYPSKLDAYDILENKTSPLRNLNRLILRTFNPMETVNLARETHTLSILPVAWYQCSEIYFVNELVHDKTYRVNHMKAMLSPEYPVVCLLGMHRLMRELGVIHSWTADNIPSCTKPVACSRAKRRAMYVLLTTRLMPPSLHPWGDLHWAPSENDLCRECYKDAVACYEQGRRAVWDSLPSYFDLPAWDVLLKE
ncbi:hypothetical protein PLICRDRAFT_521867 [Plicaturopsis crispa FD-325 SS-3]|nr:hypothetical protein PLICRDRAFT_521867 [Plicaturopsis crispa FD-325 SS-3]